MCLVKQMCWVQIFLGCVDSSPCAKSALLSRVLGRKVRPSHPADFEGAHYWLILLWGRPPEAFLLPRAQPRWHRGLPLRSGASLRGGSRAALSCLLSQRPSGRLDGHWNSNTVIITTIIFLRARGGEGSRSPLCTPPHLARSGTKARAGGAAERAARPRGRWTGRAGRAGEAGRRAPPSSGSRLSALPRPAGPRVRRAPARRPRGAQVSCGRRPRAASRLPSRAAAGAPRASRRNFPPHALPGVSAALPAPAPAAWTMSARGEWRPGGRRPRSPLAGPGRCRRAGGCESRAGPNPAWNFGVGSLGSRLRGIGGGCWGGGE